MTENDFFGFAFPTFIEQLIVIGILNAVMGIALIIVIDMLSGGKDETLMKPHAEVVDTYKGCDVVRWSTSKMAEHKYFLHCNNTRSVYEQ